MRHNKYEFPSPFLVTNVLICAVNHQNRSRREETKKRQGRTVIITQDTFSLMVFVFLRKSRYLRKMCGSTCVSADYCLAFLLLGFAIGSDDSKGGR